MENLDNADERDRNFQNESPPEQINIVESQHVSADTESAGRTPANGFDIESESIASRNQVLDEPSNSSKMEVHHHGHVHEKKKWKEYVFQFFMLFLAVFCGFLAEYQLEHTIEHNREKQFMISLIKDLEADTAQLNTIRAFRIRNITRIDTALSYFVRHDESTIPLSQMTNLLLGLRNFYQNSGTLDQLKNAGGLRLIRKRNIVDSIAVYDQLVKRMILRDKYETDKQFSYHSVLEKMFDGKTRAKVFADTTFFNKAPASLETPVNIKTEYLGEFLNLLMACRSGYQNNLVLQDFIKAKAERLITLIKREYKI